MRKQLLSIFVAAVVVVLGAPGVASAAPQDFTVNVTADDDDGSCDAWTAGTDCTLREAINAANANPDSTISFDIAGAPLGSVQTISVLSQLPDITAPVIVNGYTEPGASPNTLAFGDDSVHLIVLDGSGAGSGANGLTVTGGPSAVFGLVINGFPGVGIVLSGSGGHLIEGNFIGTDAAGAADVGNASFGVQAFLSPGNTIGGTAPGARNVVSGNDFGGVVVGGAGATGNTVLGNYIGTNAAGTAGLANNGRGVYLVRASNNIVGGTDVGAGNLISASPDQGILIQDNANGNVVQGNAVGTDVTGNVALANLNGIYVEGSSNNLIGGTASGPAISSPATRSEVSSWRSRARLATSSRAT